MNLNCAISTRLIIKPLRGNLIEVIVMNRKLKNDNVLLPKIPIILVDSVIQLNIGIQYSVRFTCTTHLSINKTQGLTMFLYIYI